MCARERLDVALRGGDGDCERKAAFFLPSWMDAEALDVSEALSAIRITAAFGSPGHRDYLGAILGLGVRRDCLGDIRISDNVAHLFCLSTIADYLLANLEQVGRCGVKAAAIPLSEVPPLERQYRSVTFTAQSLRLDTVCGGMFRISRTQAAEQIAQGNVNVNYIVCLKPDRAVAPGDVITLRGRGKGTLDAVGGTSRKGRQFITAQIWS